jgi:hypothetical protein
MTLDEALEKINTRMEGCPNPPWNTPSWREILMALEAIGVINFETPKPPMHNVPMLSFMSIRGKNHALVLEQDMINILDKAGYMVVKK